MYKSLVQLIFIIVCNLFFSLVFLSPSFSFMTTVVLGGCLVAALSCHVMLKNNKKRTLAFFAEQVAHHFCFNHVNS